MDKLTPIEKQKKMRTIEQLLEKKNSISLEWVEPWSASRADGEIYFPRVRLTALVEDCINMQRKRSIDSGHKKTESDKDQLLDFIAIHWAVESETENNN